MPLTGSSYGDVVFKLNQPEEELNKLQADDDIHQISQSQNQIQQEQAKQESIKSQEITDQWNAQRAYNDAVRKRTTLTPKAGYYDPAQGLPQLPTDPNTGRPTLAGSAPTEGAPIVPTPNSAGAPVSPPSSYIGGPTDPTAPQAGPMGMPGPGSVAQNGQVVQSPGLDTQGRPSVGEMMGPVIQPGAPPANSAGADMVSSSTPVAQAQPSAPAASAGPAGTTLKPMSAADPSTHDVNIDWDGVDNDLAASGYAAQGMGLQKSRVAALPAVYDMHIKAHDEAAKRMTSIADAAAAIPQVDFNTTDPQALQAQKNNSLMIARQQYRMLMQNGIINPQQEQQYEQSLAGGWTPELQQQIQAIGRSATAAKDQQTEMREAIESRQRLLNGQSENRNRSSEIDQRNQQSADKKLSDAAASLSDATSASDYDQRAKALNLDAATLARLPRSADLDWSPKGIDATKERILTRGMNAKELAEYRNGQAEIAVRKSEGAANRAARLTAADKLAGNGTVVPDLGLPKGSGAVPSIGIVDAYRRAAGGDRAKTKQMLKDNNWKVE